ncbi:hypothetical protein GOEFS_108_00040 [Gordonia effusa NBRC 100432]|uniref:Transmembrane protein n=1 Tax=Gordonia effusa NBRC 100432 TaxID=1077974 RepID=H0R593_9ACTN|nr:hypothetical protein [Gordonia effusa]GAB20244.1 hypothetical protein GOEFS_108_00040 [Gordonia effusa NBRC 100432]
MTTPDSRWPTSESPTIPDLPRPTSHLAYSQTHFAAATDATPTTVDQEAVVAPAPAGFTPLPGTRDAGIAQRVSGDAVVKLCGALVMVSVLVVGFTWLVTFAVNQVATTTHRLGEILNPNAAAWQPIAPATAISWSLAAVVTLVVLVVLMAHLVPSPLLFYVASAVLGAGVVLVLMSNEGVGAPVMIIAGLVGVVSIIGVSIPGRYYVDLLHSGRRQ